MIPAPFGPTDEPGFTVSVEIDHMLEDLGEIECALLEGLVGVEGAEVEESRLGCARVVFTLPLSGWWESGERALDAVARVGKLWVVTGVETCRTDLWAREPYFLHEPDGTAAHLFRFGGDGVTVAVEIDITASTSDRSLDDSVARSFGHTGPARLTQSPPGRQHIVVERSLGPVDHTAYVVAKSLHALSVDWPINRIRVVMSEVYQLEVGELPASRGESLPDWQYAVSDDSKRLVVVPNIGIGLHGWSIEYTTQEGTTGSSPFVMDTVWCDRWGIVNLRKIGRPVGAWTARTVGGGLLDRFVGPGGTTLPVDRWEGCAHWLVECLVGNPVGLVIDLGPSDYDPDDDEDVINAQLHILEDDVVMVRRSRTVLDQLRLTDHSSEGLELDRWSHDDRFDDCTDGYLFSQDLRLVATACTVWFRDHGKVDALETLGCSYAFAAELPRRR